MRYLNILPHAKLIQNNSSLPWLFSTIGMLFSILSGFVIQSKWNTWNELLDATHGEVTSLLQLESLSHHFPKKIQTEISEKIITYLKLIIEESENNMTLGQRSDQVDKAVLELEETIFNIDYSQHPQIGSLAFDLVRSCMEYREKRLQNFAHQLPVGVKFFLVATMVSTIATSLFIGVTSLAYDYLFTSLIALLAYGIFLLIDDLDHPYRPGQWHLSAKDYRKLLEKIESGKE